MKESEAVIMTITRSILTFSPALQCVDCPTQVSTHLGILYYQEEPARRTYQFLPLCPTHFAQEFLQRDQEKEEEYEEEAGKSMDTEERQV